MVYANGPIIHFVERPVPSPLQAIIETCMRPRLEERLTLTELRVMVGDIQEWGNQSPQGLGASDVNYWVVD